MLRFGNERAEANKCAEAPAIVEIRDDSGVTGKTEESRWISDIFWKNNPKHLTHDSEK